MKHLKIFTLLITLLLILNPPNFGLGTTLNQGKIPLNEEEIPLPEHPRPDFERAEWQNLNGTWAFAFDSLNIGLHEGWAVGNASFDKTIMVPFPWGSRLSGLEDEADIGWYQREIKVDQDWDGKRIFVTVGASDWETTLWLDGIMLGKHQGGYVPFSFELTDHIKYGQAQKLVIRVDDARRDFTLYGKQGYGNARGIWQTIYLEARGNEYLDALHFSPDIDNNKVTVTAYLPGVAQKDMSLSITIQTPGQTTQTPGETTQTPGETTQTPGQTTQTPGETSHTHGDPITNQVVIKEGMRRIRFEIPIPNPRLWNLEDPYLYEVTAQLDGRTAQLDERTAQLDGSTAQLDGRTAQPDVVNTYFGMRKISVVDLPGTEIPYIALNNEPIYLQLALDQSYHPDGFYTFPSDQFIQEEIMRSKSIGLNGIRTHIKVEVPRKLYWADKMGLLVMEDLPNSWGEPYEKMQYESEYTLREMIKRDYNHPSIFSWVLFNETWGLTSVTGVNENGRPRKEYTEETQDWVVSMYYLAKSLDPTRLSEDNSICCGRGHTVTDINSWHQYLPGWGWEDHLKNLTENTYEGSGFNYEERFQQGKEPNINSECGNVWGYDGSTGDVDWSWDYHRMINTFRTYPKVGGWLYTEHHDVINEWNGYWRFDRTEKETGLGQIVQGMNLNDLHARVYLSTGNDICKTVNGGEQVEVPLHLSVMTGENYGEELTLSYELSLTNYIGETEKSLSGNLKIGYTPWMQQALNPLKIQVPDVQGVATLILKVEDSAGKILHRNFMHFEILSDQKIDGVTALSTSAKAFSNAGWSKKQWNVLEGKKVNGAGEGFFEYSIPIPRRVSIKDVKKAYFLVEVSAKELFVKDMEEYQRDQDFMRGSLVANSANPNSYPMTDETLFPSKISVIVDGEVIHATTLADDPADHRGVLSWHHQLKDRKLREAGSYGYLLKIPLKEEVLQSAMQKGELKVRIQTEGEGGIAVYGREFGRYALDPSLVLVK